MERISLFFNKVFLNKVFRNTVFYITVFCIAVLNSFTAFANPVMEIELTVPALEADPYHRPYVAVWIETPARKAQTTVLLWHYEEDKTWLKDLRQWWRKLGRYNQDAILQNKVDGYSGATRRPDTYAIAWDGLTNEGLALPAGEYLLNIEAVREEGDRTYLRQAITLGQSSTLIIPAEGELGDIEIKLNAFTRSE